MTDIEQRLQSLRSRQQEAMRLHAQAQAKLDSVRARRDQILKQMEENGFSSPEEARAKVAELTDEVEEILKDIEAKVQVL